MVIEDRTEALAKLSALCEPSAEPMLLPEELEIIIDSHLLAAAWQASHTYVINDKICPRNDHVYIVTVAGTSGETEPAWVKATGGLVTSGDVTLKEDGLEFGIGYDVDAAAREAWDKKMAKASEFVSTPGVDMGKIFEKCSRMRDRFETVVMA